MGRAESSIREFYDLGWFFGEADNTNYEVSTSLDDETIFKLSVNATAPLPLTTLNTYMMGKGMLKRK
jgi:hypothetical protein